MARLQSLHELEVGFGGQEVLARTLAIDLQQQIAIRRIVVLRRPARAVELKPEAGLDESTMKPVDGGSIRVAHRDAEPTDNRGQPAAQCRDRSVSQMGSRVDVRDERVHRFL